MYAYKTKGKMTARMRVPRKFYVRFKKTCDRMLAEALGRSRG